MPTFKTLNAEESATYIRGMANSIAFGSEEKHRLIEAADHMVRLLMRLTSPPNSAAASVLRSARYERPAAPDLYLVWNTARGLPSHQHGSVESAVQECQRLAKTNPGQRFLVMAPIGAAQVAMADFRYFDGCAHRYSFIPF